jgi:hypothetical protein
MVVSRGAIALLAWKFSRPHLFFFSATYVESPFSTFLLFVVLALGTFVSLICLSCLPVFVRGVVEWLSLFLSLSLLFVLLAPRKLSLSLSCLLTISSPTVTKIWTSRSEIHCLEICSASDKALGESTGDIIGK